jgi:hypothetical protein
MAAFSRVHQDLATANRHIAEGRARVAQQAKIVRELDAGGHDTTEAQSVLRFMERNLDTMNTHREYILSKLSRPTNR